MLDWWFKFLLTIPLVWLFVLGVLDLCKDVNYIFFGRTLDRLYKNKESIRNGCRKKTENCPIFKVLKKYNPSGEVDYAKKVGNIPTARILEGEVDTNEKDCIIWSLLKGMCINYQQAGFFEVITIQFLVGYLLLDSGVQYVSLFPGHENLIKLIYGFLSLGFFLGPWLTQTYLLQQNSSSYTHLRIRFSVIMGSWIVIMIL
jgi:hypothetical protein